MVHEIWIYNLKSLQYFITDTLLCHFLLALSKYFALNGIYCSFSFLLQQPKAAVDDREEEEEIDVILVLGEAEEAPANATVASVSTGAD